MARYSTTWNKNALVASNSGITRAVVLMWVTQVHASMACHFLILVTTFLFPALSPLSCQQKVAIRPKKKKKKNARKDFNRI